MNWKMREVVFEADEINPGLAVSPWSGHRLFAYDLTANMRPERIVELGTHYGCSLFTFLQACKDEQVQSEVIAIDCWEGDEQAGFYGEEVLDTVKRTIGQKFSKQNPRLIRKFFADALEDVEDESADIIHIDGLHTYEAVREDFDSWICKLKRDGIMLFHDVNSGCKYGTDIFWRELEERYACHYMFRHSWGLGVLFPKGDRYFKALQGENFADKVLIYENRAELQLKGIQLDDHKKMVQERDALINKMNGLIGDRDQAMETMQRMIEDRDDEVAAMERMIEDRDSALASAEEMVRDKDSAIAAMEQMIRDRDAAISSMKEMIEDKDKGIACAEEMVRDRDQAIASMEKMIGDRDATIASMNGMIGDRDATIASMNGMIGDRDAAIASMEEMIRDRDTAIASTEKMVRDRDEAIGSMEKMIQERDALVSSMDGMIRERDETIERLSKRWRFGR